MTRLVVLCTFATFLVACGASSPEPQEPVRDQRDEEPVGGSVGAAGPVSAPPATDDATWQGTDEAEAQEGQDCATSGDCPHGLMCFGPEGCDVQWTCVAPRPCTRDLTSYCACDGTTVDGSGSCPPRAYAHRGACS